MKIGVDIVDLDRLNIDHDHFVRRILTDKEYEVFCSYTHIQRKKEYLGGRFAGKEAYMKAQQKGLGQISFHDIEILNREDGSPYLNDESALISISHEKSYAVAFVVIEK